MVSTAKSRAIIVITLCCLLLAAVIAIGLGSVRIAVPDILSALFSTNGETKFDTIIFDIRLPRVLLALIIGANIAISGALLQAVMGNPLADPGLTGVTSGAAACVLVIMLVFPEYTYLVPIAAFVGGVIGGEAGNDCGECG